MTEKELIERMQGYSFYHTIQLTENVRTNGWEVVRPTTMAASTLELASAAATASSVSRPNGWGPPR